MRLFGCSSSIPIKCFLPVLLAVAAIKAELFGFDQQQPLGRQKRMLGNLERLLMPAIYGLGTYMVAKTAQSRMSRGEMGDMHAKFYDDDVPGAYIAEDKPKIDNDKPKAGNDRLQNARQELGKIHKEMLAKLHQQKDMNLSPAKWEILGEAYNKSKPYRKEVEAHEKINGENKKHAQEFDKAIESPTGWKVGQHLIEMLENFRSANEQRGISVRINAGANKKDKNKEADQLKNDAIESATTE